MNKLNNIRNIAIIGLGQIGLYLYNELKLKKKEIEKHNINRDSMNLIDEDLKNKLHQDYKIQEMIGGGSLGNSMFGITSFGGNGSFIGKIKDDKIGKYLQNDMVREGLEFPLGFTSPDVST